MEREHSDRAIPSPATAELERPRERGWSATRAVDPARDISSKAQPSPATPRASGQRVRSWSGRRASNPLPRPWQGRALPSELLPLGQRFDFTRLNPSRQTRGPGWSASCESSPPAVPQSVHAGR